MAAGSGSWAGGANYKCLDQAGGGRREALEDYVLVHPEKGGLAGRSNQHQATPPQLMYAGLRESAVLEHPQDLVFDRDTSRDVRLESHSREQRGGV